MSTWHQRQVPAVMPGTPCIVTDPPNDCRAYMIFDTEREARARMDEWQKNKAPAALYSYISVPYGWRDPPEKV